MANRSEPLPHEQQLLIKLQTFADDPEAFVRYVFPWGKENSPLANKRIKTWQLNALRDIKAQLIENRKLVAEGKTPKVIRMARVSGRGIGKSAFLAWLALWMWSCIPASTVIVAANSEPQLKTKTFPEIKKWAAMSINSRWFEYNATSIRPQNWLSNALKRTTDFDDSYWYIQATLWSEEMPDAFAGAHSQVGMLVLFDEASGIPNSIWPVTAGYFTDITIARLWVAISNGRRPTGSFFDCFHRNRDQWNTATIDARTVEDVDMAVYEDIIRSYGADSDEARVEVYGQFPKTGDNQFIGRALVDEAKARDDEEVDRGAPLIMGVDPARFGNDMAVIRFRQGRNARDVPPPTRLPKCSAVELANIVASKIEEYRPDAVFVEGDGVGGPVCDILKDMGYRVQEVTAGGSAEDGERYANHRTEMWGRGRDWLATAILPDDDALTEDLCGSEYKYTVRGAVMLESKEDMKKRGLASPNDADALMMTFSRNVARSDRAYGRKRKTRVAIGTGSDIFG